MANQNGRQHVTSRTNMTSDHDITIHELFPTLFCPKKFYWLVAAKVPDNLRTLKYPCKVFQTRSRNVGIRSMCICCFSRYGATWTSERMIFIPCFHSRIIHHMEPGAHAVLWCCSDNRMKAPKSSFESTQPFADPIGHERVAELSEARIHSDESLFINPHFAQIPRIVLSNNMLRCIIERAIRATIRIKNCVQFNVTDIWCLKICFKIVLFHIWSHIKNNNLLGYWCASLTRPIKFMNITIVGPVKGTTTGNFLKMPMVFSGPYRSN
jgi:hypothetical protein